MLENKKCRKRLSTEPKMVIYYVWGTFCVLLFLVLLFLLFSCFLECRTPVKPKQNKTKNNDKKNKKKTYSWTIGLLLINCASPSFLNALNAKMFVFHHVHWLLYYYFYQQARLRRGYHWKGQDFDSCVDSFPRNSSEKQTFSFRKKQKTKQNKTKQKQKNKQNQNKTEKKNKKIKAKPRAKFFQKSGNVTKFVIRYMYNIGPW